MIMGKAQIEYFVYAYCMGSNIEVVEVYDWDGPNWTGLEFNLYDYLNKGQDFESDINALIDELEKYLDANIFIREPIFQELPDTDDDGNEIQKYHCFLYMGKNC